jgi:endonuclease/exonuclease/phosphatase family metal-dependent hydrolase
MSVAILLFLRKEIQPATNLYTETGWRENMAFIALGPYLTLQLIVFQNQGWMSELSRLSSDWAFLLVMSGNFLAMVGVISGYKRQIAHKPTLPITIALLIAVISFTLEQPGGLFIFAALVVQTLFGWSWAEMGTRSFSATRKGLGRTTILCTLGLLIFILLAFMYYASLDIPLPFSRHTIFPTAGIIYGACYLGLVLRRPTIKLSRQTITLPLFMSGILCLVPIFILVINSPTPNSVEPRGKSFKVMTYNIHSAYNIEGHQDPEAIARVIEESNADIITFQEISRGWLVNGSTDLVSWLSKRLDMQALFHGTTGPMWGNAVLSRYPILSHTTGALPALDTPLERGYLWAIIDVGTNQPINLIATHLHHVDEDSLVRLAQVNELIRVWDGKNQTILLGDLNARPDDAELKPARNAGFIDAWYIAGQGEGFTYSSNDPFKRIDWIWHTPDLTTQDINVLSTTASDHLPVVVTIHPAQ